MNQVLHETYAVALETKLLIKYEAEYCIAKRFYEKFLLWNQ